MTNSSFKLRRIVVCLAAQHKHDIVFLTARWKMAQRRPGAGDLILMRVMMMTRLMIVVVVVVLLPFFFSCGGMGKGTKHSCSFGVWDFSSPNVLFLCLFFFESRTWFSVCVCSSLLEPHIWFP